MAAGGANIVSPQASPQSKTPQQYNGGTYTDGSTGQIDQSTLPTVPRVPGNSAQGAGGQTSVDTSSLKQFADNMDTLAGTLGVARTRVENLQPVACGTFNEAKTLAQAVTGDNGLQQNYSKSLHLLRQALMDTADSMRTLAGKYSSIEEVNQKAGSDLQQLIQKAQSDTQALGQGQQSQGANGSSYYSGQQQNP
ncbi:hypothetical protein ACIRVK_31955 [Streptomyces sp. NPDC101152]|uniref:hypothetical protein n=1 Tax=Streptomyces sp. NPDC101152 TaxID=3366116 RepID=UPI0038107494